LIDERTRATHPLRSARITRHQRYYGMVRPPARIGTLILTVSAAWSSPSRRPVQHPAGQYRGEAFPSSTLEPEPSSRHLCAGHRQANKQALAWLVPGQQLDPGFDVVATLSTVQRWFTRVRLLGSHL